MFPDNKRESIPNVPMKRRRGMDKYTSSPYFILNGISLLMRSNTIMSVTAGSKDTRNRKNEGNMNRERMIFDIAALKRIL